MLTVIPDTKNINNAIREIARYSGVPLEEVIENESSRILEAAARYTPAAQITSLREGFDNAMFTVQSEDLYTPQSAGGREGRARANTSKGGILYYLYNRYPDQLWNAIEEKRKASLQAKLKARGLSKRAWAMLARAAGLTIKIPAFAEKAVPSDGRQYPEDALAVCHKSSGRFGIFFQTTQPTVITIGGRHFLQRAIDGRYKYYTRNLSLGVFRDLKKIAAKYPGLVIR